MLQVFVVVFIMSVTSWVTPRMFWSYRYYDAFSVLLMALPASLFAFLSGALGYILIDDSILAGSTPRALTGSESAELFHTTLYGLTLALPISLLSGILYANRLKKGGLRFGQKLTFNLLWGLGYSLSRARHFLSRLRRQQ